MFAGLLTRWCENYSILVEGFQARSFFCREWFRNQAEYFRWFERTIKGAKTIASLGVGGVLANITAITKTLAFKYFLSVGLYRMICLLSPLWCVTVCLMLWCPVIRLSRTMKHNQTEHRNNNNNSKLRMLYNCNAFLSFCYELIMCIHVNVYFYWMLLYNDVSETLLISVISYICINMYLSIFA